MVRFSFAVAKIEQKLNTNQILPRNIFKNAPLSCIHFPINKRVTRREKFSDSGVLWEIHRGKSIESRGDEGVVKRDGHADYPTFPEYI